METLTPTEVAKILKLHPFSVTRLARQKKRPAFKVGGSWRFQKNQFKSGSAGLQTGTPFREKIGRREPTHE